MLFKDRIELIGFIVGIFVEFSWLRETSSTLPTFLRVLFALFLFSFFEKLHNPRQCSSGCRWKPELQHAIRHWDRFACKRRQVRRQYGHGLMYQGGDARSRVINKSPSRRLTPLFLYKHTNLVDLLLAFSPPIILQDERG